MINIIATLIGRFMRGVIFTHPNHRQNVNNGKLIFFCGKMGAGKSTKASEIAQESNAVLLSEDE
jgi:adenylylsulfate kinase-like enzyme